LGEPRERAVHQPCAREHDDPPEEARVHADPERERDDQDDHVIAIANFIGLPLFFLSSTLISIRQIPHWMQEAAKFNPVNWGVIAAREVVLPSTDWNSVGLHLALLLALSVATAAFATWTFRAYQKTI
jgi:ABC-2 type transport system permease protein